MLQTPGASTAAKVALTDLINSLDDLPSSQAASTRPYVLVLEDYHIIDAQPVHEAFSFTIKIHGHLDDIWTEWFEGLTISRDTDGTTTLYGPVRDQAKNVAEPWQRLQPSNLSFGRAPPNHA